MANRQQRRAAQRNGLGDMLGQLAQRAGQQGNDDGEDLNNLPKPNTQTIDKLQGFIEWQWHCGIFMVQSCLQTASGEYKIELTNSAGAKPDLIFDPEEAKAVGQALVSAWNWKDIWKVHAGGFIAKELGIPEPKEDNGDE